MAQSSKHLFKSLISNTHVRRYGTANHFDHPLIASYRARQNTITFKNELQVPRLPIPNLEDTCAKYIKAVTPLLTPAELDQTKKLVQQFLQNEGPQLHKQLQELDSKSPTSWLEGWWDTMYRELRCPTPINVNPFFVIEDHPTDVTQAARAAGLIVAAANFVVKVRNCTLEPEMERTKPMSMCQYDNIFASRIPHSFRDQLHRVDPKSRHIVILYRDNFYSIPILDEQFQPIPKEAVQASLQEILSSTKAAGDGVGLLSTEERTLWSSLRGKLLTSDVNKRSLRTLDDALFVVCLEDAAPTLEEFSPIMLHNHNGRNRWFDKSLQLIVTRNAKSGINMEHSGIDGQTTIRFTTDIHNDSLKQVPSQSQSNVKSAPVSKLEWQLTSEIKSAIKSAEEKLSTFARGTPTEVRDFKDYGKKFIVSHKLSPDGVFQMALQLAYYRQNERLDSTYESASTRGFFHGRTETVRSVTSEAKDFVQVWSSSKTNAAEKESALRRAVEAHVALMSECKNGLGVDRHLYGMYNIARHNQQSLPGYELPQIYLDKAYSTLSSSVLSTSHCGTNALTLFGFGPVVQNGYGVGYFIKDNGIPINITTFERPLKQYSDLVVESLLDIKKLLEKK